MPGFGVLERRQRTQQIGLHLGFDVDDRGAVIRQRFADDRTHTHPGEVGDFQSFERRCVGFLARRSRFARGCVLSAALWSAPSFGAGAFSCIGVADSFAKGPGCGSPPTSGPVVARRELRIGAHVADVVDRCQQQFAFQRAVEQLSLRAFRHERADGVVAAVEIVHGQRAGGEVVHVREPAALRQIGFRVGFVAGPPQHAVERAFADAGLVRADHDVAVFARHRARRAHARQQRRPRVVAELAGARRVAADVCRIAGGVHQRPDHGRLHRHVEVLAETAVIALVQRDQDYPPPPVLRRETTLAARPMATGGRSPSPCNPTRPPLASIVRSIAGMFALRVRSGRTA